ncbi:MAG: TetR/AcrR family transcriptional regulator [Betaproteobacteria bacterium]
MRTEEGIHTEEGTQAGRGPRARMRKLMLDAAMRLMQDGLIPSVSDVAQAAQVSRATAYRYFPTQAALIQAAVDEALGPILAWQSASADAQERVTQLVSFAYPRMEGYEATLRAALRLSLDQWARRHAGLADGEAQMVRGHRIGLLHSAIRPLKPKLTRNGFERLTQSLSLVFGTEAFVVLKDIWGLDRKRAEEVALWTCHALIQAAVAEDGKAPGGAATSQKKNGASRGKAVKKKVLTRVK